MSFRLYEHAELASSETRTGVSVYTSVFMFRGMEKTKHIMLLPIMAALWLSDEAS